MATVSGYRFYLCHLLAVWCRQVTKILHASVSSSFLLSIPLLLFFVPLTPRAYTTDNAHSAYAEVWAWGRHRE